MTADVRWLGWGYLAGRELLAPTARLCADAIAVEHASAQGWSDANLTDWANSSEGKHFARAIESGDIAGARLILIGLDA
jgi:hypothetical protein